MYPNKKEPKELDKEDGQCLICWDKKNVYKMQSFVLVTNTCKCNSKIHGSCLFNWIYQTQSCPICRKPSHFNIKLLKYFLKNKQLEQGEQGEQVQPFTQVQNLNLRTYNTLNPLYEIYKVSLCLLQFIAYIFLYSFIYSLILSIRREVEMMN